MKNISPISPPEEVVPEQPVQAQPEANPENAATPQPELNNPVSAPQPITPSPESTPQNTSAFHAVPDSLYPTPMTLQERSENVAALNNVATKQAGFVISQYAIPLVVGIYAISSIWNIAKALYSQAVTSAFGVNASLLYGFDNGYVWLALLITLLQVAVMLYASYKVFHGSKVGLALVTGASLMVLPQYISLIMFFGSSIGSVFSSIEEATWVIGSVLLGVSLIIAWTKERKLYY